MNASRERDRQIASRRWAWSVMAGLLLGLLLGAVAINADSSQPIAFPLQVLLGGARALEITGGEAIFLYPLYFLAGFLGMGLVTWPLRRSMRREHDLAKAEARKWRAANRELIRRVEEASPATTCPAPLAPEAME